MKNRVHTAFVFVLMAYSLLFSHKNVAQVDPCFSAAVIYTAGVAPISVTSADFNSDGNMDVAIANFNGLNLSVLFGSSTGTFAAAGDYATDSNPFSITSADFNNDGHIDIATANYYSANISVFIGSASGTFAAAVNYSVGTNPKSISSVDLNNDGNQDLAIANNGSNDVSILIGSSSGTFATAINYSVSSTPESIISKDFNNDGNRDLAVANSGSNNVSILIGSGTGTFAAAVNFAVGSGPQSVSSADFNNDGNSDLAVCNAFMSNVSILLGSGTGTFAPAVNYSAGTFPLFITTSDFNNDGNIDLAVGSGVGNNISILMGSGTGIFATTVDYISGGANSGPSSISPADFNHDGMIDLAVANPNTSDFSIFLNGIPNLTLSSLSSVCLGNSLTITANGANIYSWNTGANTSSISITPTVTTSYTVTGTVDATGCTNTVVKTIIVNALPTITVNNGSICEGNSFTMTPSGASTYTVSSGATVVTPTTNTSYTVTGTDVNGCINNAVTSVTVNSNPTITAVTNYSLMCVGETASLTASGATSYTWNTNETATVIAVSPTVTTNYTLTGTDANGCSNVATVIQSVSMCTGFQSVSNNQQLVVSVYPNPGSGIYIIELPFTCNISVIDVLGKVVYNQQLMEGKQIINLSHLSNGVYMLKVGTTAVNKTVRLIKE